MPNLHKGIRTFPVFSISFIPVNIVLFLNIWWRRWSELVLQIVKACGVMPFWKHFFCPRNVKAGNFLMAVCFSICPIHLEQLWSEEWISYHASRYEILLHVANLISLGRSHLRVGLLWLSRWNGYIFWQILRKLKSDREINSKYWCLCY